MEIAKLLRGFWSGVVTSKPQGFALYAWVVLCYARWGKDGDKGSSALHSHEREQHDGVIVGWDRMDELLFSVGTDLPHTS
ncbi:hypothetical protein J1614_009161 [Plenodomus biglobosus]|nr:hypothetical protein J1614_009161 [Plenodomus biglobosus]